LALITDAFGGHGGIAQYNRDFLTALCRDDRVAEVVAIPRVIRYPLEPLPDKLVFDVAAAGGTTRYLLGVTEVLLAPGTFDLIYCGHIHLLPLAWGIARFLGKPLWLQIHGIDAWQSTSYQLANHLVARVTRVLSVSELTLNRFIEWSRFPRERCDLVPNAIHMAAYGVGKKPCALVERYGLAGRTILLTLGRLASEERTKGFDEVLELLPDLIRDIPNVAYVIAGDGNDGKRLREKARTLGLADRVVFTGRVVEQEKADLYRLADAYVMPSRGEGFGIVLLEAMACGVPVVASRIDGGREALRDGALGILVDPENPGDVRRGILEALQRPRLIPEGLEYFSFANFIPRVHALIGSVLSSKMLCR
jgi:glycosyltransferase involved in cell wall biosynthesis